MNHLTISYQLSEQDLECAVCYTPIYPPIYSCCSCFTLYLCRDCNVKTDKCPSCRSNSIYHCKQLEQLITWSLCDNKGCGARLLPWAVKSHLENCEYSPGPCVFCSESTTSFTSHLKECTECEWIEKNSNETSGSLNTLVRFQLTRSLREITINLQDWNENLAIVLPKAIIIISKGKTVGVLSKDSKVDCYYSECNQVCMTQTILTINNMTLKELNEQKYILPVIPTNTQSICFKLAPVDDDISISSFNSDIPQVIQEEN